MLHDMEHARIAYLEDLLATNTKNMERDIADARDTFSVEICSTNVPPILCGLSHEEWGLVRSIIYEVLMHNGRLTDSMKIPILYLAAESWDTVFWIIEYSWCEELELEEVIAQSYCEELKGTILRTLPCMLPPHRLQELSAQCTQKKYVPHGTEKLFQEIQRIREESGQRAAAIQAWCAETRDLQ